MTYETGDQNAKILEKNKYLAMNKINDIFDFQIFKGIFLKSKKDENKKGMPFLHCRPWLDYSSYS